MDSLRIWTRVGDQDDYHSFDSLEEAAYHIHRCLHSLFEEEEEREEEEEEEHEVQRYTGVGLVGIEVPESGFSGYNGISLYYGDEDSSYQRSLDDVELTLFTDALNCYRE